MATRPIQLGHVHILVRNLERATKFYTEVVGLKLMGNIPRLTFLTANEQMHHEITLVEVGEDATGPDGARVGLDHLAWQMETFQDLKEAHRRLKELKIEILRIIDHHYAVGVYFPDPDGNENEFYYELPREQWYQGEDKDIFRGFQPFPWKLEEEGEVDSPRRAVSVT